MLVQICWPKAPRCFAFVQAIFAMLVQRRVCLARTRAIIFLGGLSFYSGLFAGWVYLNSQTQGQNSSARFLPVRARPARISSTTDMDVRTMVQTTATTTMSSAPPGTITAWEPDIGGRILVLDQIYFEMMLRGEKVFEVRHQRLDPGLRHVGHHGNIYGTAWSSYRFDLFLIPLCS